MNKTFASNVSNNLLNTISTVGRADNISKIFLRDIKNDFSKNIASYLNSILMLNELLKTHPISLAIWGCPPVAKTKALIFEFLRSKDIKVLGAQHGCLYGEVYEPWHFDSDFNRCDYFMSYGFTKDDLKRLYPEKSVLPEIVPVGKVTQVKAKKIKKTIDVLFPITNSTSLMSGGFLRIPPDKLTERQIRLLEYLNTLEGFNICVKPFAHSNYENCSVLPVLKRLKNLKVFHTMSLEEFLTNYHPKSVLIEYPSQPLVDVLHLDTEVFLMNDCLHPYNLKTIGDLQKRVHYSEDTEDIIAKMELFLKGGLEKKRDNTFYYRHVYKKNTRENILALIDNLTGRTALDVHREDNRN